MKKRLSNLTLKEIKEICRRNDKKGCKSCPFYKIICDDMELYYATLTNMNKRIETKYENM